MYTLEQFRDLVGSYAGESKRHLPVKFWEDIANPWFTTIFPIKNETYGVEGLQRLGPMHAVAEFVGCYYRWQRMTGNDLTISYPSVRDSLHDAFGYSVIMRAMVDQKVRWEHADRTRSPGEDLNTLVSMYWDSQLLVDEAACTMAVRASINMYRRTLGV